MSGTLKDRIDELRRREGLRLADFAERINVSLSTVNKWRSNESKPEEKNIRTIVQEFGVSEPWLLYGINSVSDNVVSYDRNNNAEKSVEEIFFLKQQLKEKSEYIDLLKYRITELEKQLRECKKNQRAG